MQASNHRRAAQLIGVVFASGVALALLLVVLRQRAGMRMTSQGALGTGHGISASGRIPSNGDNVPGPLPADASEADEESGRKPLEANPAQSGSLGVTDATPSPEPESKINEKPSLKEVASLLRTKEEYQALELHALRAERDSIKQMFMELNSTLQKERLDSGLGTRLQESSPGKVSCPPELVGQLVSFHQQGGTNHFWVTSLPPAEYPEMYAIQDSINVMTEVLASRQ